MVWQDATPVVVACRVQLPLLNLPVVADAVKLTVPVGLAPPDREAQVGKHPAFAPSDPIRDIQLLDAKRVGVLEARGRLPAHVSNTLDRPSVTRLTPITSDAVAPASNSTVHQ